MIVGEIKEISPDAKYQDTVYTQTVTVDLDGTRIELFDGTTTVATDDHIDEIVELQITVQPINLEPSSCTNLGITEDDSKYKISGLVQEMGGLDNNPQSPLIIDIGLGTIEVETNQAVIEWVEEKQIERGTTVAVLASRLDLKNVEWG